MRKDFYIFRHGETDYNLAGRWQGQSINIGLNETGIIQAQNLAEKLKDLRIGKIYSSPLKRARQTAEIVAKKLNTPVEIIPELTEGSLGICEGMYRDDVKATYPDMWDKWYSEKMDMDIRWPEGETKGEIQKRMCKAFEQMLESKEDAIGVASHGGAIRYFLVGLNYGPHKMPNTVLFHIIYEDGKWIFDKLM